jgi:hypothetical protein
MNEYIKFKYTGLAFQFFDLNKNLQAILNDAADWAKARSLPFVITRMIDEMIIGVSKTDIHRKKRACDLSRRGWSDIDCRDLESYLNIKYASSFGAYSITDGLPRACVLELGMPDRGDHFHIQVRSD